MLRLLTFFPSINFGLIQAEIFPYALVYSILRLTKIRICIGIYIFTIILIMSGIIVAVSQENAWSLYEFTRSAGAYLNSLLIFSILLRVDRQELDVFLRLTRNVFCFFVGIMFLQSSGSIAILDPVFTFLVPRAAAEDLGYRGVTLLSSEPARASVEFLFLYTICRLVWIREKYWIFTDYLILFSMAFFFKSATGLVLFIFFAFVFFSLKQIFYLITFAIVTLTFALDRVAESRALDLFFTLSDLSLEQGLHLLLNTSGNRLVSIIAAFQYIFVSPFGGGVGNWKETSAIALSLTNIDPSSLNYFLAEWNEGELSFRSSGWLTNLAMDLGLLGVIFSMLLIFRITKPFILVGFDGTGSAIYVRKYLLLFLFNFCFVGAPGAPVPWIVTALALRVLRIRQGLDNH